MGVEMGDETVIVRTSTNGESVRIYHSNPDCQNLIHANNTREVRRDVLMCDVRECRLCSGESPNPKDVQQDHGYRKALLEAAEQQ